MEKLTQEKAKAVLKHIVKKNLLSSSGLTVCGIDVEFTRYITGRLAMHGIWIKIYTKEGSFPILSWLRIQNELFPNFGHEVAFLQQDVDWCHALRTIMKAASNGNFFDILFHWTVIDSNDSIERALVEMDLDAERQ